MVKIPLDIIRLGVGQLQISVRLFTTLREVTGKRQETLEFSDDQNVTIDTVLKHLANRHGKGFTSYVYDRKTGNVRGFLQFLVNGRSALAIGGMKAKLKDGDVVAIIPPVGGG